MLWSGPSGDNGTGGGDLDEEHVYCRRKEGNWDFVNTIEKSPMFPYCGKSTGIWHCPADPTYGVNPQGQRGTARIAAIP